MSDLLEWLKSMTPGGVGIWTAVGLIAVALIRQKPITQKLTDEREGNLLKERAADMRGMRRRIAQLEAEQRVDRHVLGNLEACFDALLMMIELDPSKGAEAAAKAKEMRARMKIGEAAEKAAIMSDNIAHAAREDDA